MQKKIAITLTVLSGLIILDSLRVADALLLFFAAGQIPGTSLSLSADVMLLTIALISGVVMGRLSRLAVRSILRSTQYSQPKAATLLK